MKNLWIGALLSLSALSIAPSVAQDSGAMFDYEKEVTLRGFVKEFQYTNPHSWLIVDVANEDGSVTTWGFEAEGPSTLLRAGIRKNMLKPGVRLTIVGHPMRDGRPAAAWISATLEDGTTLQPLAGFAIR